MKYSRVLFPIGKFRSWSLHAFALAYMDPGPKSSQISRRPNVLPQSVAQV